MIKLTNWIKGHQVTAFFIITFAITWGLGFSYDAALNKGMFLLFPLASIATCGPALAGIIISAVSNTQPRQGSSRTPWIAFLVAWVVSALVFLAHNTLFNIAPLSPIVIGFSLVLVVPVAFVISMAYSRIPGVRAHLGSLIRLRGVWDWSLLALLLLPGLSLISFLISRSIGRQPFPADRFPDPGLSLIGLIAVKFLYQLFFFNATGEEVGWRGFALPTLQARTSPLIASLVLAFFWAPWHLFLWQAEGLPVLDWQYWLERYAVMVPVSLTIVWICNRAKGSILVAGITHAAANTADAFLPRSDMLVLLAILYGVGLLMIWIDGMWKKLPSEYPAVYMRPSLAV